MRYREGEPMKRRSVIVAAGLLLSAYSATAQSGAVRVLASNGIKAVIDDLQPQAERVIGRPLAVDFDTSSSVKKRIEGGEAFDVAILPSDVIDDLAKAGEIMAGQAAEGLHP